MHGVGVLFQQKAPASENYVSERSGPWPRSPSAAGFSCSTLAFPRTAQLNGTTKCLREPTAWCNVLKRPVVVRERACAFPR
jgi:hypothetical protein